MTTRHLTLAELQKRNRDLIEEERQQTKGATSFWYLSYAGPSFLGGVIVRAFGFVHACQRARDLNINPGGEIRGFPIPTSKNPAAEYVDKLLSKAELEKCWGEMVKLSKLEN
jgi:hypothetical protein